MVHVLVNRHQAEGTTLPGPTLVWFIDESRQRRPSRQGMGPLFGVAALAVPESLLPNLEKTIGTLCSDVGFPPGEEFKWSPRRNTWMYRELHGPDRIRFQLKVCEALKSYGGRAVVVIVDECCTTAMATENHVVAAYELLFERIDISSGRQRKMALVRADEVGGGPRVATAQKCNLRSVIKRGTQFSSLQHLEDIHWVDSSRSRAIQACDLIIGCSVAFVAGSAEYAEEVFKDGILPILETHNCAVGGRGLKLHPDFRYRNLYHWLLGDTFYVKDGTPLPNPEFPFYHDAWRRNGTRPRSSWRKV